MLPELQKQFMDALLRNDRRFEQHLNSKNRASERQLNIYQSSYIGGLLKALSEIYPVTCKILGETFFNAMCSRYIKQTPCHSIDINRYGESFADFASHFDPVSELVYLVDLIRLEWAWHRAYQTPDYSGQDFSPLLSMDSAQLASVYLLLPPSMTLLASPYPIDTIWTANQAGNHSHKQIDLDTGACRLVIWRKELDLHIDSINDSFFDFLIDIQNGAALMEQQEKNPDFIENLTVGLQRGYFYQYQC